jgi:hypothetical protein
MLMKMTEEIKIIEEESVIEDNRSPAKVSESPTATSTGKKATDGKKKKKVATAEKKKEEGPLLLKKEVVVVAKVEQKIQEVARDEANEDSWNVVQLKRKV